MTVDPGFGAGSHKCLRRETRAGIWAALRDHSFVILHLIFTVTFGLIILYVVDGSEVGLGGFVSDERSGAPRITQPLVSALISLGLVAIRGLSISFLATIGWQMALTILTQEGVTLRDLIGMIKYRIAPWRRGSRGLSAILWLVFLLSIPAQIASPLLTSAIKWVPIVIPIESGLTVFIAQPGPTSPKWAQHNMFDNNRDYEIFGALGVSSFASPISFEPNGSAQGDYCAPIRARFDGLDALVINSTLETITVPYLRINSLKWVTSAEEIEQDFDKLQMIKKGPAPTLVFGNADRIGNNPFWAGTDAGRLVLDNDKVWGPATLDADNNSYLYPSPIIREDEHWVVLATAFDADSPPPSTPEFGQIENVYQDCDSDTRQCYAYARMNYTAGALECRDCPIVLDNFVESIAPCTSRQPLMPLPDPLVDLSLAMISELLFYLKAANTTEAPSWENIDAYTRGMISVAYQASWNSLTSYFSRGVSTEPSAVRFTIPQAALRAEIDKTRTVTWIILNVALTVSSIVVVVVRSYYGGIVVKDAAVTALMLDTTDITLNNDTGLCNATELRGNDRDLRVRLEVARNEDHYTHPKLVRDISGMKSRNGYKAVAPNDATEVSV
ncbi:hypothetical protein HD806DRAFT_204598 [Xylariaceae sp. AK1471]|nr:hypothetical protein HD806DRAFT_204598 [Xylariaceae sp. AK1471]